MDAVGYLTLDHLFVAHMSGNSAKLGAALGRADLAAAAPVAAAVGLFVLGIALGSALVELGRRRGRAGPVPLVLGSEVALLVGLVLVGELAAGGRHPAPGGGTFYAMAALAVVAMGLQTSALQRVGGRTVRTTYVSGVLTNLARQSVAYAFGRLDRCHGAGRAPDDHDARRGILLLAAIWLCYAAGGTTGGFTDHLWRLWSLALPVAALAALVLAELRRT